MKKQTVYVFLSMFVMACGLSACGGKKSNKTANTTAEVTDSLPPQGITDRPVFTFVTDSHDFGQVEEGELVKRSYRFTNTGTAPLIISDASAQCGCTVPQFPKNPVAVGETNEIVVHFNSKERTGIQNKEITITANTEPTLTVLTLRGEVVKKSNP